MARKQFDLIVFDWDGTLMDSTAAIVKCIQSAASDLDLPVPDNRAAAHVIGLGLTEAMQAVLPPEYGVEWHGRMAERYRFHYLADSHRLTLFEGVREMLAELDSAGYLLAVATGKSRAGLDRVLQEGELESVFAATRCADETFSKPHPAMLLEIAGELGQDLSRMVMIGDTTHDLQMAKNAGAAGVGVEFGAHPRGDLEALQPLFLAGSVPELNQWLRDNA